MSTAVSSGLTPLRRRQAWAVTRLELKKGVLGGRSFGLYLLALMPVIVVLLRAVIPGGVRHPDNLGEATSVFAMVFQFELRLVIFFGCVVLFGNLIRREMLDRSLHYYFLTPVRREVLGFAKLTAGVLSAWLLFLPATLLAFFLAYAPYSGAGVGDFLSFLSHGPGLGHLAAYLAVTALACIGYGALFFTLGLFFKSPAIPGLVLFGWEWLHFLLPPLLKKATVVHYLLALCPVPVPEGPLALMAEPPSVWVAVPTLLLLAVVLLALSAWRIRRLEIAYEED
jgi:hypothetical protein